MTTAMVAWRQKHPKARRENPVAIVHNGSRKRVYGCICGGSISMCAKWPITRQVSRFIAEHNQNCQPV